MKVWFGYGTEHSANLVIIGEFESVEAARAAEELLERVTEIARADEERGFLTPGKVRNEFSPAVMELWREHELSLDHGDPEQLLFDFDAKQTDNRLVITTDETNIQAFLKVLLHGRAKIQLFSAHDHDSAYGRRTRG